MKMKERCPFLSIKKCTIFVFIWPYACFFAYLIYTKSLSVIYCDYLKLRGYFYIFPIFKIITNSLFINFPHLVKKLTDNDFV